jgi:hypothetical protein
MSLTVIRSFMIFLIAASFAFVPAEVFAKETSGEDDNEQNKTVQEEPAIKEAGEIDEAAESSEKAPALPTIWDPFPPDVQVYKWGEQFRIQVTANPDMPIGQVAGIQSVKLEKMNGEFLGYRPFAAGEPRQAIFMTDPAKIDIDAAVLTISSTTDPELKKTISLEHPADNVIPITAPVPPGAEQPAGSKKKKWPW